MIFIQTLPNASDGRLMICKNIWLKYFVEFVKHAMRKQKMV
jgi:hypothetical protein